jgi:hypothetical protein
MPMAERRPNARLERECRAFGRYLLRRDMNAYVCLKYARAHEVLAWENAPGGFDSLLVRIAAWHPLTTKLCDAYARFFSPRSFLRKKLVLLLAIAEVSPPYCRALDATDGGGWPMLFARIVWRGMGMALCLLLALPVLLPLQMVLGMAGSRRRRGESHA